MTRDISTIELPDEILELLPDADRTTDTDLLNIAQALVAKKSEAMNDRLARGIDSNWTLCEDMYHGIDEVNRGEHSASSQWIKPTVMNAPLTQAKDKTPSNRSTAFVRLTSRYVDSAAAKIAELLLGPDDRAFSFAPTPVPTLIDALKDQSVMSNPETGTPMERTAFPGEQALPTPIGSFEGQPTYPLTTSQVAEEQVAIAAAKAKKAELKVWDWMVECGHSAEMRRVIHDAARIGVGVLKGPFPKRERRYAVLKKPGLTPVAPESIEIVMKEELSPADKWVNPWNIFPDPACGDNIRNGSYIFEREFASEKQLRDLIGLPGYLTKQIERAIDAGPNTKTANQDPNKKDIQTEYELWYFFGAISRKELAAINPKAASSIPSDKKMVSVSVTMVGDVVIKGTTNPLETSGDLPYLSIPWQPRSGSWVGVGVAEQVRVPQEIVNGATRGLLNNAGISAGPQIVITQGVITPADGRWELTPNKVWYMKDDGTMDDVAKAFISFSFPNVGQQIMQIVEYGMRLAEESSSIPLVTQGLSGQTSPETYGATQLQDNNANQLLRSIAATFDNYITKPLVTSYYEWYLLDESVPAEDKGEFVIHAQGSLALVEKAIQDRSIVELQPIFDNPKYMFNPKKVGALIARSRRLNPAELQYTEEEQRKIEETPPPPAPAVQVAQIKAEVEKMKIQTQANVEAAADASAERIAQMEAQASMEIEQIRQQTAQLRIKMDTDRDNVYVQTQLQNAQTIYNGKLQELQLKKEIAISEFAMQQQLSIDQAKTKLADTAMKLKVQKELAVVDAKVQMKKDALKPPVQTPGRAKDAFSQM